MAENLSCPVCGADVGLGKVQCERCGFRFVGTTEEIEIFDRGDSGSIAALGDRGRARLTLTKGPLKGEVFYLESFPVSIGREPKCDIFLNNMTVSREHAIIENINGHVMVKDQDSLNGTWVDGKIIDRVELYDGSLLQIGTFSMRFSCS